jgi:hypothetical protein
VRQPWTLSTLYSLIYGCEQSAEQLHFWNRCSDRQRNILSTTAVITIGGCCSRCTTTTQVFSEHDQYMLPADLSNMQHPCFIIPVQDTCSMHSALFRVCKPSPAPISVIARAIPALFIRDSGPWHSADNFLIAILSSGQRDCCIFWTCKPQTAPRLRAPCGRI